MKKLLPAFQPCPFCGSKFNLLSLESKPCIIGETFYMLCMFCEAKGPESSTKKIAVLNWNKALRQNRSLTGNCEEGFKGHDRTVLRNQYDWYSLGWNDALQCAPQNAKPVSKTSYGDTFAKGHNPDYVTALQLEYNKGYRLLNRDEIKKRKRCDQIDRWDPKTETWITGACGSSRNNTFRTFLSVKELEKFTYDHSLAKGHNPDKLTNNQLATQLGYRLLTENEIYHRLRPYPEIEMWDSGTWKREFIGDSNNWTYRTLLSKKELAKLK